MKKFSKGLVIFALVAIMMVSALPVSAAVDVNSSNFKPVFDFDKIPTEYTVSSQPGSPSDIYKDDTNKKFINALSVGLTYNLSIVNGEGISGNALKLDVSALAPESGSWDPVTFNVQYGKNAVTDVSGAEGFMFWMDNTKFKDTTAKDTPAKGIQLIIYENDCDKSGQVTKDQTVWLIKNQKDGGFFYLEDGKGGWVKTDAGDGGFFSVPNTYKGWVRVPMASMTYPNGWGNTDVDGKFNGKYVWRIDFGIGNYASQVGSSIVFDDLGFYGSFKSDAVATAEPATDKVDTTTAEQPVAEQPADASNPKTGDAGVIGYVLMSAAGLLGAVYFKKKK